MKKLSTILFLIVLLLVGATNAMAQFTNGKVYRIVCSGSPSVSLGASALSDVAAVSTSETDRAQQWYVTGSNGKYTFRNLANGRYLLGHKNYSNEWRLTEESNEFTVDQVNGNYAIYQTSHGTYYTYMHKDGSNNIVSWESSAANSQWTPYEVSYTAAELQAIWNEVESFVISEDNVKSYEESLLAIFTDKACTQLNSTYASKSVSQIEADANYQALPAELQAMVLKVKNDDWSEANAVNSKPQWGSDYAKKFRVQMYEPYSIEGEITSYLRINAHCNMDNPTGIYANANKAIYIMVEGEIKEGAELWVAYQTGLGATNYYNNASYTQLREGLNVVPYFYDTSSLWINYVVHTYNSNGATLDEKFPHKLSDYKPLKIHIEGGHINGYYNAIGDFRAADSGTDNLWGDVDNDDDWNYYMERAPLDGNDGRPNRDFPLLAHRQTLLFPLAPVVDDGGVTRAGLYHRIANIEVPSVPNCYGGSGKTFGTYDGSYPGMGLSTSNGKINIMLEAWDRIMYSQLASMGVVSKSTMDKMNALYPRWTSAGTPAEIYDYNNKSSLDNKTYLEFCNGIDYSEYFNHHGCGIGWPNGYMTGGWRVTAYHYETMEGIIGTIANASGSTWGPAHEIGHQHQSIINLEGQTEVTNNLFANIAVWYMGMGTSRYDGSQGSLESVLGAFTTEGSDLYANNIWALTHLYYRLWLYYHLAGNNTQFWPRLFELCRQVPLENHPNGTNDGSTTLLRFYQHACDAAGEDLTEFFRAHGYFEVMDNRVVGDYYGATYNQTQEQIDAAIASVKAKDYPANYAVLLINDGTSETTFKHNGATRRGLWDGYATAEFGSVNDFISGDADVTTNYEARLDSDGSITMSGGEGGIGFLMFNEDGELVAFSNKSTFKLGKEAKELYQNGQATIAIVDADNEIIELGEEIVPDPEDQYEVKVQSDPAEGGTATVNGNSTATVDSGSTVTLTATANDGYAFDGWYLNSTQVSTSSTYTPKVTGNVTYVAKFSKEATAEPEPGQPAQESGYYYLVNRDTNRREYLYNDALNKDNSLCFTLQSDAAVSTNNGVWYITFNDNNTLGIKNGDGKPLVAGANWGGSIAGSYDVLTINETFNVDDFCYYYFSEAINCTNGSENFKVNNEHFVTTWSDGGNAQDNQWRLESVDMKGKSIYDVEIEIDDPNVYVEYTNGTNTEYAYNGGFFITGGVIDANKLAVQGNASATAVVEGNVIKVVGLDKTALRELIADMQSLLGEVVDKATSGTPIALQVTDINDDFYLWSNATAWDCNGIGALIDKNDDGTAKTGTFFGTTWDSGAAVNSYDHYIEIDLGTNIALSELSFDYTTRNSTHSDQRPTSIKILGSTDKDKYEEVTTISEGLPTGQNQKWELSSPLALNKYYRYLRFAVATEVGYFNMSDFNLYAHSAVSLKDYYLPSGIASDVLFAMANTLQNAIAVADGYVTSDEYNTALSALQAQYAALSAVKDADVSDRTELENLVTDTEKLLGEVSSGVSAKETIVPLQCTDANAPYYIYCNAPGATNNYRGDNLGVAALLDVDDKGEPVTATFLHSSYVAGSHDDNLDHYLRVDMGESNLLSFKFRYIPRIGNNGNAPLVMLIEGSNDCVNFEEITTLTDMATTYQSQEITNGKAYRYIRFMVKETHNHSKFDNHEFFAMSYFEMTACKTVSVKDGCGVNLAPSLVMAAHVAKEQAELLLDNYTNENVYNTMLGELQAAYNALNLAKQLQDIPVVITTDVNKPVLYKIKINRDGDKCLQYDEASGKVDVSDVRLNRAQAWYFMVGDDATKDVLIIPYKSEETVLATNSFSEGTGKVDAVEKGTAGYSYNWNITKVENSEWYNITILNGSGATFYFSNHGGVGNKMGFYNHSDDVGSQFQFVLDDTDYSLSDAYFELCNLYVTCGGKKAAGEAIGMYKETTGYNECYNDAATLLEDTGKSADVYAAMYTRLQDAFNALERNMPEAGALYRIRSANANAYSKDHLAYVNSENKPHFDAPDDENLSNYIWQFEVNDDGYSLKNLHTQTYVQSAGWGAQVVLAETPTNITIEVLDDATGELKLNVSRGYPLHAQNTNSSLVGYTGGAGSASAWYIEKVENASAVYYPYKLTDVGYGTLMLGFDTEVPESVTAYWAESVNGTSIEMVEVGKTIPANTPVILKRNSDDAVAIDINFTYKSSQDAEEIEGNKLGGTLYRTVVACASPDRAYVMQVKDGVAKMYWAYANINKDGVRLQVDSKGDVIVDADGKVVNAKEEVEGGSFNHDKGGYIKNSANRAYLIVPSTQAQPSILGMRFGVGATKLDEVEAEVKNDVIYDLQGRKLDGIIRPGFYIVNGKKMLVK